jgi:hypothetical protein
VRAAAQPPRRGISESASSSHICRRCGAFRRRFSTRANHAARAARAHAIPGGTIHVHATRDVRAIRGLASRHHRRTRRRQAWEHTRREVAVRTLVLQVHRRPRGCPIMATPTCADAAVDAARTARPSAAPRIYLFILLLFARGVQCQ